jgi:1-acyl-sn-glycerol-3-phosphate acyltransferase
MAHTAATRSLPFSSFNYYWRLVMTGIAFLGFSIGGLILSFIVLPLFAVLPGKRRERSRLAVRGGFRMLVGFLRATGVMRLEISGIERLADSRGALIFANHPTLIDAVVLLAHMPLTSNCVVKGLLATSPVFAGAIAAAGYIKNDSTPWLMMDDCVRALRSGDTVIIFPEGTRTTPGEPLKFLPAAAHIALKSGRPIVPAYVQCMPPTLYKGAPWYEIPAEPFFIRIAVREDLHPAELAELAAAPADAARQLTRAMESHFSKELRTL